VFFYNPELIDNGEKTLVERASWVVRIYNRGRNGVFYLLCGGSIIAPNIVISGKIIVIPCI